MATNTAGGVGRQLHTQQVHTLRVGITYEDGGSTISLGYVPAGSIVIGGGVVVSEGFDAGDTNLLDLGTADDPDGFGSDVDLTTAGLIGLSTTPATSDDLGPYAADTQIVCVPEIAGESGNDAEAGSAEVFVYFIPDTDG